MQYNRLGRAGLRVSELSFGSWVTFGKNLDVASAKEAIKVAFDYGVNFFDNAEVYAHGKSEEIMGEAIRDFRREDLVISTKLFWGGEGPNDTGLSHKHLMEGIDNSLKRLQLDYVDLLFCHRPDPSTPIEETVRAMDIIVRSGRAFYWGTSEWNAEELEMAYQIAKELGAVPPSMEQPEYNLFHRARVEKEYASLYERYGMGTTIWSPLAMGVLTGKYNSGDIPKGSRMDTEEWLRKYLTEEHLNVVRKLEPIAQDLGCNLAQLSLAWCLKNPNVSTVITGASRIEQIHDNMKAIEVKDKLSTDVMERIEGCLSELATE